MRPTSEPEYSTRLRIAQVVPHFVPEGVGGIQHHVHDITTEMARRHEVTVLTWSSHDQPDAPRVDERQGFTVVWLGRRETPIHSLETKCPEVEEAYRAAVSRLRPDIVHIHQLAGLSAELVGISRESGARVLVSLHDYLCICPTDTVHWTGSLCHNPGARCFSCLRPDPFSRKRVLGYWRVTNPVAVAWARTFGRRTGLGRFVSSLETRRDCLIGALDQADRIIAPSRALVDVFGRAGLEPAMIETATHGIRPSVASARPPLAKPLRFGFIGSNRVKGLALLLKTFREVPRSTAELVLYTRLDLYEPALRKELARLVEHPFIEVRGGFGLRDIDQCYSTFDVLVAPSVWVEPFGLVAAEAVARGVPVIAADSCGLEETVLNGVNGLLFERGSEAALAAALNRCASDLDFVRLLQRGCGAVKTVAEQSLEIESIYLACLGAAEGAER